MIGIESNPSHLDPRYATDANSARISSLIYSSLLRLDDKSRLVGDLAEQWTVIDAQTYDFQIRSGVTFHDGRALTVRDVKFTYDSIMDRRNRSPKRGPLRVLKSVEQLGTQKIRFHLSEPHAPFLEHCTIGIVPVDRAWGESQSPGTTRFRSIYSGRDQFRRESVSESKLILLGGQTSLGGTGVSNCA